MLSARRHANACTSPSPPFETRNHFPFEEGIPDSVVKTLVIQQSRPIVVFDGDPELRPFAVRLIYYPIFNPAF